MSAKDELRLKVVNDFREGRISRAEAALLLGVSWRTVSRLAARIRREGPAGVGHGNRGRQPSNRCDDSERMRIMEIAKMRYFDFNMTHCYEMLVVHHELRVSLSTFKSWCRKANFGQRKRRRPSKQRLARERMSSRGLMLQMDGSDHTWVGNQRWCLIGAIDDASSEFAGIKFFRREDTFSCLAVLRYIVETHGIPHALYVDQARWFGGLKAEEQTQFSRVCSELGITLIPALSPQAKGRIERAWRTLQDRLIPELRLHDIKTMFSANEYLRTRFIPDYWHKQLTSEPRLDESRYRRLDKRLNLDEIFCQKYERSVLRDHTIHFETVIYKLILPFTGSISGKKVTIHRYSDSSWRVFYGAIELKTRRMLTKGRRRWLRAS